MRWGRYFAYGLLALLVGGLLILQIPLLQEVRGWAWQAWGETIGRFFDVGPWRVPNNVAEQLATLQAENVRLRAELHDYSRLREQVGAASFAHFTAIPAKVMAASLDAWHARVVINRGARQGLVLGAPAVIRSSQLIGLVTELHDTTAVLQLLFHPATNLPAEVLSEGGSSRGLLQGKAYTSLVLSSVPRDRPLSPGQDVVTTSQEPLVPQGLLVGKITAVENEPHEPYQRATVEAPWDPDDLWAVAVLVPRL